VDGVAAVLASVVAALRAADGRAAADEAAAGLPLVPIVVAASLLFALRDVPAGASLAKWLLGLRVETRAGTRPGLASRLARAPWSVLPLGWLFPALEHRTPWRVVAYAPSTAGLALRLALAVTALGAGSFAAFSALRPGITRDDATRLARATIAGDPLLQRALGAPLEIELGRIAPRRALRGGAVFELQAYGPRGRQSMTVVARRVADVWAIEEVVDIETVPPETGAGAHAERRGGR
jgi:hypothetical protein